MKNTGFRGGRLTRKTMSLAADVAIFGTSDGSTGNMQGKRR
ncbi:MAG TPA: hypothetical protein PLR47_10860 [Smithellaceae bacterium]|nr:hypothetical protein [Smithellaceae bacterium]